MRIMLPPQGTAPLITCPALLGVPKRKIRPRDSVACSSEDIGRGEVLAAKHDGLPAVSWNCGFRFNQPNSMLSSPTTPAFVAVPWPQ